MRTAASKPCRVGDSRGTAAAEPPKTGGLWWRGRTECGPVEKGMANHFSSLALRTPGTGEPGGLPSRGCTESDATEAT